MSDNKEVKKEETPKDLCEHKHPGGAIAFQVLSKDTATVLTEAGLVPVTLVTWICPYCYGIKQVPIA